MNGRVAIAIANEASLPRVTSALSALGFDVRATPINTWDVTHVPDGTYVVAIDEGSCPSAAVKILMELRRERPGVRVIWIVQRDVSLHSFAECQPDYVVSDAIDPDRGWDDVAARLQGKGGMADVLVDRLLESVREGLDNAFGVSFSLHALYVRAASDIETTVTTLLPFMGDTCGGHLLVSGEPAGFTDVWQRLVPGTEPELWELQDLAGEMANLALGRVSDALLQPSSSITMGLPIYMTKSTSLLYRATSSGIVIRGYAPESRLSLEVFLKFADVTATDPSDDSRALGGVLHWI